MALQSVPLQGVVLSLCACSGCGLLPLHNATRNYAVMQPKSPGKHSLRIVSLAPSITEILQDLHASSSIVGVTTADNRTHLPSNVHYVGTLLQPSREGILACNPQLVIAVQGMSSLSTSWLRSTNIKLLVLPDNNMADVYQSILQIGRSVHRSLQARTIVAQMRGQIAAVESVTSKLPPPRVLPIYQLNPIYTSPPTSFVSDAIRAAGGTCLRYGINSDGGTSPEVVVRFQPQVILCDKRLLLPARNKDGWTAVLPAVRSNRCYLLSTDNEALVRPTPRLAVAIVHLACFLHPQHARAITRAFVDVEKSHISNSP